jgi:hypothetical protein
MSGIEAPHRLFAGNVPGAIGPLALGERDFRILAHRHCIVDRDVPERRHHQNQHQPGGGQDRRIGDRAPAEPSDQRGKRYPEQEKGV